MANGCAHPEYDALYVLRPPNFVCKSITISLFLILHFTSYDALIFLLFFHIKANYGERHTSKILSTASPYQKIFDLNLKIKIVKKASYCFIFCFVALFKNQKKYFINYDHYRKIKLLTICLRSNPFGTTV